MIDGNGLAMACSIMVCRCAAGSDETALALLARAGRSRTRGHQFLGGFHLEADLGIERVRLSKKDFWRATSGYSKLTAATLINAK